MYVFKDIFFKTLEIFDKAFICKYNFKWFNILYEKYTVANKNIAQFKSNKPINKAIRINQNIRLKFLNVTQRVL